MRSSVSLWFIFYNFLKIYLFLAALGLRCYTQAFSSCGERGLLFIVVHRRPLITVAYLCRGARALGGWASVVVALGSAVVVRGLWSTGSVVVAHGPSCSVARGILLDEGSNLCPLHRQADS